MTWAHVTVSESRFKLRDPEPENEINKRIGWQSVIEYLNWKIEKVTSTTFNLKKFKKEKRSAFACLFIYSLSNLLYYHNCYDEFQEVPDFNFSNWYLLPCPQIYLLMQVKSLFFGFIYWFHGSWPVVLWGHVVGEIWASCSFPHSCLPSKEEAKNADDHLRNVMKVC